eukprot:UC4_evm1s1562
MSGSSRQDVADDYEQRISDGAVEAELGVSKALEKLTGLSDIAHCNCNGEGVNIAGDCLNISVCTHITGEKDFTVVAWNIQGHTIEQLISLPVQISGKAAVENKATHHLAFIVKLPPVGYSTFSVKVGDTSSLHKRTLARRSHVSSASSIYTNGYYQVTLDPSTQ